MCGSSTVYTRLRVCGDGQSAQGQGLNFKTVLVFAAAFVGIVAVGVYWMGPSLASLAFFDAQRTSEMHALLLLEDPDSREAIEPLLEVQGARVVADYSLAFMPEGKREQRRPALLVVKFMQARHLVRVLTDGDYPASQDLGDLVVGGFEMPESWPDTLLLWMVQAPENQAGTLPAGLRVLLSDAELGPGLDVVWAGELLSISRGLSWNGAAIARAANVRAATDWVSSDQGEVTRARFRARYQSPYAAIFSRTQRSVRSETPQTPQDSEMSAPASDG